MENETIKEHLYILIICGGGGTRLWPRSRKKTPKQFLNNFFGKETLFTQTVNRAQKLTTSDKIFVITNGDYVDEVITQGNIISTRNIIAEPIGKNTAVAMGVAAAYIKKVDPQAIILNFYSDALIQDSPEFTDAVNRAVKAAKLGDYLVSIGLKPTFAHTGLGYIEAGQEIEPNSRILNAISFKEKPDLETAQKFLTAGNYFWNAGFYCWSATAILNAFAKYSVDLFALIDRVYNAIGQPEEKEVFNSCYENAKSVQIDTEISEKADNKLVVPANFSWSDVGDWKVTYELKNKDKSENVIESFGNTGRTISIDSKNCLVEANNRLVAIVGVENLVVVETDDAILICNKDKSQDVKKVVEELKANNNQELL